MTEKYNKIIEEIEKLTALELSELVKALEEKFGVSASAGMMVAPAASLKLLRIRKRSLLLTWFSQSPENKK